MAEIIRMTGKRFFSLTEANALLPVIRRITADAVHRTEESMQQLSVDGLPASRRRELEKQINFEIETWVKKIERLGCEAKGLWLVDFDFGAGYFCWQHGEEAIGHTHGYNEGFSGRQKLAAAGDLSVTPPVKPIDDEATKPSIQPPTLLPLQ